MLDLLISKTIEFFVSMGYLGMFFASFAPLPTEAVVALLAASPEINLWKLSFAASLGSIVGGIPIYLIGYLFTEDVLYTFLNGKGKFLRVDTGKISVSKQKIRKYSFVYVFVTRLIPWLRLPADIASGYVRVNFFEFCISLFAGMFVYTIAIAYLGKEAGNNWDVITKYLNIFDKSVILLMCAGLIVYLLYKGKRKVISKVRDKYN